MDLGAAGVIVQRLVVEEFKQEHAHLQVVVEQLVLVVLHKVVILKPVVFQQHAVIIHVVLLVMAVEEQ